MASAQAWLPDKGSFNATFLINDILNTQHWTSTGDTVGGTRVESQTYALLGTYGLTDRWMVSASMPFVNTHYSGPPSHGGAPGFDVDDGDEHGSWTDLRVGVHFQALEQWLRRTYAQMRYSYAFGENVLGQVHDRDNLGLEIGTFITSSLERQRIRPVSVDTRRPRCPHSTQQSVLPGSRLAHRVRVHQRGTGTGFSVTPDMTLFMMYMHGFEGRNDHRLNRGLTLGLSYGFRPRAEAVLSDAELSEAEEP